MKMKDFLKTISVLLIAIGFLTLAGKLFAEGTTPASPPATEGFRALAAGTSGWSWVIRLRKGRVQKEHFHENEQLEQQMKSQGHQE